MQFSLSKIRDNVVVDHFVVTLPDEERPVINLFSAVDQAFDRWAPSVPPAVRSINGIGHESWVCNLRNGHDLQVNICK